MLPLLARMLLFVLASTCFLSVARAQNTIVFTEKTADFLQGQVEALGKRGYVPMRLDAYVKDGNLLFDESFEKSPKTWDSRLNLTDDEYDRDYRKFIAAGYHQVWHDRYFFEGKSLHTAIYHR